MSRGQNEPKTESVKQFEEVTVYVPANDGGFDHREGIIINRGGKFQLILVHGTRHLDGPREKIRLDARREHLGIQSELIEARLKVFKANSTILEKGKPEKGKEWNKLRIKLKELF